MKTKAQVLKAVKAHHKTLATTRDKLRLLHEVLDDELEHTNRAIELLEECVEVLSERV